MHPPVTVAIPKIRRSKVYRRVHIFVDVVVARFIRLSFRWKAVTLQLCRRKGGGGEREGERDREGSLHHVVEIQFCSICEHVQRVNLTTLRRWIVGQIVVYPLPVQHNIASSCTCATRPISARHNELARLLCSAIMNEIEPGLYRVIRLTQSQSSS